MASKKILWKEPKLKLVEIILNFFIFSLLYLTLSDLLALILSDNDLPCSLRLFLHVERKEAQETSLIKIPQPFVKYNIKTIRPC